MGVAISIGATIAGIFASIGAVVWTIVSSIGTAVATIASWLYGLGAAAVATVSTWVNGLMSTTLLSVKNYVGNLATTLFDYGKVVYETVKGYALAVEGVFKTFAEFIHLSTLIQLHNVGMILSEDYRKQMQYIYGKIGQLSQGLGLEPQFINLALRQARTLILDASSIIGEPYDIGEIKWVGELSGFLTKVEKEIHLYGDNPYLLLRRIDEYLIKNAVDAKSKSQLLVLKTIQETVNNVTEIAEKIDKTNQSVANFVSGLPSFIRNEIQPITQPITNRIDAFIGEQYQPKIKQLNAIINTLNADTVYLESHMNSIMDKIRYPGSYLKSIDGLAPDIRLLQENDISDVANRRLVRDIVVTDLEALEFNSKMQEIIDLIDTNLPLPEYDIPEVLEPNPVKQIDQPKRTSWFVGDY